MLLAQQSDLPLRLPQLVRRQWNIRDIELGLINTVIRSHRTEDGLPGLCRCDFVVLPGAGPPGRHLENGG